MNMVKLILDKLMLIGDLERGKWYESVTTLTLVFEMAIPLLIIVV